MRRALWVLVALTIAGCTPSPSADPTLVLYEQPHPSGAARLHALEIGGAAFEVTGVSMLPLIHAGDWATADLTFAYDKIAPGDVLIYRARWLPASSPMVIHMAAAKLGDEWIMKGINNHSHEREANERMGRAEYRGKVLKVYTKRAR